MMKWYISADQALFLNRRDCAMIFKRKWFLVYSDVKLENMYKAEKRLREHGITYKTNVFSRNLTSFMRNFPNERSLLYRAGREDTIYQLYTPKEEEEKARFLLSKI